MVELTTEDFVTKDMYDNRVRATKWVGAAFFGMLSVFLGLVVYSSASAYRASIGHVQTNEAVVVLRGEFETHKAEQGAIESAISDKLDEIRKELSEQRAEQRVLLEKIIQIQVEAAREHHE